jgi:hypothetical protein
MWYINIRKNEQHKHTTKGVNIMKYNFFKIAFYAIVILLCAWIAVSYVDVINHQNCGGTDAMWNFFIIMLNK